MKKFNYIWIFSDSIKGHEIQSQALATKLSDKVKLFHCTIRQPWLSFAPRILPRFGKNIIWENSLPDIKQPPDVIITCGRRMAAIGKYFKRIIKCQHFQILNPGDNAKKYDLLICPEHDGLFGSNVINTKGSLHNISTNSLAKIKCSEQHDATTDTVSVLLGNPADGFFKELHLLANKINKHFPKHKVLLSGSRRTPSKYHSQIKTIFSSAQTVWLDEEDGENPYLHILACSDVIIVTADSINMVSEACATDKKVIVVAQKYISPKHKKFISSVKQRVSNFDETQTMFKPIKTLDEVTQKILSRIS